MTDSAPSAHRGASGPRRSSSRRDDAAPVSIASLSHKVYQQRKKAGGATHLVAVAGGPYVVLLIREHAMIDKRDRVRYLPEGVLQLHLHLRRVAPGAPLVAVRRRPALLHPFVGEVPTSAGFVSSPGDPSFSYRGTCGVGAWADAGRGRWCDGAVPFPSPAVTNSTLREANDDVSKTAAPTRCGA
eukprot:gene5291-biopygen1515